MINLTAIVPFYNEENTLRQSVQRLLNEEIFSEIILSDDNSSDNSLEIAKTLSNDYQHIKYISSNKNLGKGNAINNAVRILNTSHVVIHDADLEYFPADIVKMYEKALTNQNSLILGSRFIGTKKRENVYLRTYVANRVMSIFFSLVNFYWVSDVATCYKLMPSKFLKNISIKEQGFSIEIEMLSKFLKYNKHIHEVPISYEGRSYEEGKKIKVSDGIMYILNTLKYRFI
jgi:glycosyltransferase involved in cell wall biosynthesis